MSSSAPTASANWWSLTPWLLFFCTVFGDSAVAFALIPIPRSYLFILGSFAIIAIQAKSGWINHKAWVLSLFLMALAFFPAVYWPEPHFFLFPIYFILSILIVSILDRASIGRYVDILSWLAVIILIGAFIGTLYAYFGGSALYTFANEDGRTNQLFLTTLTNFQVGNLIRPSGISDEPGALSFWLCCTAAMRHHLGRDKRLTWVILIAGFITFSVAHMLFVAFYTLETLKQYRLTIRSIVIVVAVATGIFLIFYFVPAFQDMFSFLFLDRLGDRNLGEDRSGAMQHAYSYLNESSFFYGIDPECATGAANCMERGYKLFGENPLALLTKWGIFTALPYYLVMIYGLIKAIPRANFVLLGVLMLLLQRPNTMSVCYSLLILVTIFVVAGRSARDDVPARNP